MTRAMHRILVVEGEAKVRNVIRLMLESEQFRVAEADTAATGIRAARNEHPDLILLDLGLPDADGTAVIHKVRAWSPVPILVLSACSMEDQKITALGAGADDYVTKPFSAPELLDRVRAGLRRNSLARDARAASTAPLKLGDYELDLERRLARGPSGEIHLTPMEFRVIECLARNSGLIVTQQQLIREVWGPGREHDTRNLRVVVKSLRHKIERDPRRPAYLVTAAGVGYRLNSDRATP